MTTEKTPWKIDHRFGGEVCIIDPAGNERGRFAGAAMLATHLAMCMEELDALREQLRGESALASGDGTARLLAALYGESSEKTIGKAIGGPNARMLGDAAKEIERLRLLLTRKNCALDVFASPSIWSRQTPTGPESLTRRPGDADWLWLGAGEYAHPVRFAAKERDADEPTD